ncbi:uncharacterized protein BP5553_02493 [Venustampulla echinocandica]|uniref:DUF7924 domain-containing protein n=1 Tax=Venustampulla echinocandica TaxID=2656787 RepID=A0A370U413_9HELO|nr:uncharacterized protein BP5553_02493 [Venustampulla echinocandica]RDL42514.1 hypothetical protein BP5553_02493 [Venustampulla echinocandica]
MSPRLRNGKVWRQPLLSKYQEKPPQGIRNEKSHLSPQRTEPLDHLQRSQRSVQQPSGRKRKRSQDDEGQFPTIIKSPSKQERTCGVSVEKPNPVEFWVTEKHWPKDSKQYNLTWDDLKKDTWYEKFWDPEMNRLLPKQQSSSSLHKKQTESGVIATDPHTSSTTASYQDIRYQTVLAAKGSYLDDSELGITNASKSICRVLLRKKQTVPQKSLFRADLFKKTCKKLESRNEARLIQDVTRLIVPSAETLATFGAKQLEILVESVHEGWNNSIPITQTRPQPDYAVGFGRGAFTEDQLKRLKPLVGEVTETSFFMATYYMYFPFLTCEVKYSNAALDVADRQNAYSMTIAARGIVKLLGLSSAKTSFIEKSWPSLSHTITGLSEYMVTILLLMARELPFTVI